VTNAQVRVAVLDDYQGVALTMADWGVLADRAEVDVFREHCSDDDALVARLAPYDVIVMMRERTPMPRRVIEALPRLRVLVTTGARNASIDLAAAAERGATVCGTPGSGIETAELTWVLLLTCARRLDVELASMRAGGWTAGLGTGLHGRTLGLLGLGRLGSQVAAFGQAFGMRVLAWSQNLTAERCAEVGAEHASLDELLGESDFVSVHLKLSPRTQGLLGEAALRSMKPTAWLVNTSRGPIVDEDALLRACQQHWIAGAALDVYDTEPLPADHPFRTLDNVIATPHVGYVTEDACRTWYGAVVEDIAAYLDGAPIRVIT
jgi:phosphoglycerate dehydrogenase-like enzyme